MRIIHRASTTCRPSCKCCTTARRCNTCKCTSCKHTKPVSATCSTRPISTIFRATSPCKPPSTTCRRCTNKCSRRSVSRCSKAYKCRRSRKPFARGRAATTTARRGITPSLPPIMDLKLSDPRSD